MVGTRRPNGTEGHLLQPGEYCYTQWGDRGMVWMACSPDGRLANLANHIVAEHEDQTISALPSILVSGGGSDGSWHGYLERGVWKECQD
jgi:hypothetical protein